MLRSMGSQRVGHDLATEQQHTHTHTTFCKMKPFPISPSSCSQLWFIASNASPPTQSLCILPPFCPRGTHLTCPSGFFPTLVLTDVSASWGTNDPPLPHSLVTLGIWDFSIFTNMRDSRVFLDVSEGVRGLKETGNSEPEWLLGWPDESKPGLVPTRLWAAYSVSFVNASPFP